MASLTETSRVLTRLIHSYPGVGVDPVWFSTEAGQLQMIRRKTATRLQMR